VFDDAGARRVEQLVHRYLDGRERLFDQRVRDGRIRDGHGDLQADDIFLLDDGPRILDCLEFDAALRWDDVLDDVAFLAMDLERLGRADLASRFFDWHRELSGDAWPPSLSHHFVAYRAHIRAKVNAIRHAQGDAVAGDAARSLLALCRAHLEEGRVRAVLVGGLPGTGKSTIAAALGGRLGYPVLRTDVFRGPPQPERRAGAGYGEGRYRQEAVEAVYDAMLDEAKRLLELGESVVLDASWSSAAMRSAARDIAAQTSSEVVELQCVSPTDVAADRIRARTAVGIDPSEATPDVATAMAAHFDAWPEAVAVDTVAAVEDSVGSALDIVRS
jgi:predicted kinase